MSYTIYHADGTPVTVPDNVIDTTFYNGTAYSPAPGGIGTQLVGRNAINYGAPVAQNFLQMTENFASNTAHRPTDTFALQGQLWFEKDATNPTSDGKLYLRIAQTGEGAAWRQVVTKDASGNISNRGGTTPVVNPTAGQEQNGDIKVVGSTIYIWANAAWRQIFPAVYS